MSHKKTTWNDVISYIKSNINLIQDKLVKISFSEFIDSYINDNLNSNSNNEHLLIYKYSIEAVVFIIKDKYFSQINWNLLCSIMHSQEISEFFEANTSNKRLLERAPGITKRIFKLYIIFLINNTKYATIELNELRLNKNIVKDSAEPLNKSYLQSFNKDLFESKILTSYPLESQAKSIYQVDKNKNLFYNLNLNTSNDFLILILKGFIDKLAVTPRISANYRLFYFFFEESFGEFAIPNDIYGFNFETFKQQLDFYDKLPDKIHFYGLLKANSNTENAVVSQQRILVQFYIYLIEYIESLNLSYNVFYNSWITKSLLKNSFFLRCFCNGYIYTYYNPLEDSPVYDKWWLDSGEDGKKSASLTIRNSCIDFTQINDEMLKQMLKKWLWYGYGTSSNIIRRKNGCSFIIDFLKFKFNNEQQLKKVISLSGDIPEFNIDLFFKFRIYCQNIYKNKKTLREHFIDLRSFLKCLSNNYYINEKCYKYLTVKGKDYIDTYGCPITPSDFQLILGEFKNLEKQFDYGVLLTNIFYLASTTNIRPGEILNLERNCIVYKDNDGNGTIKLRRKPSKGKFVHQEVDAETMKIIEDSIAITNDIVENMENNTDKKFIFIGKTLSTSFSHNYQRLGGVFVDNFRKIILSLDSKLENYYTPYNLRDTFINIVYDNFEKYDNKDIDVLKRITGNSVGVVLKNYRRKFHVREYVEALTKVIISDVDINGNIFEDDSEIIDKAPVFNNLGFCKCSKCNFESDFNFDKDENLCLICNNFITSISRVKAFEKKIHSIRSLLDDEDNIISDSEKKYLITNLKLYGSYLEKMLEIKNIQKK